MKRNSFRRFVVIFSVLLVGIILAGCASAPAQTESNIPDPVAGPNESIIVIQRKKTMAGAAITMKLWIDETETTTTLKSGQEAKIVISNGEHVIQAGSSNVDKGPAVTFSVNSERIIFFAEPKMGAFSARFELTQTGKDKL